MSAAINVELTDDEGTVPTGWMMCSIADVTQPVSNFTPTDFPQQEFGYVDISSVCNRTFTIGDIRRFKGCEAPSRARRPIKPEDVLFSNVRTYLRNVALVGPDTDAQLCSTGFTLLRSNGAVDPRFLFRYLLTDSFIRAVTPRQTGSNYPATTDRVVMEQAIALPPLAEQQRIVAAVEALLQRVDAARQRLARVPEILKRFRQQVLAAACSGALTADWRGIAGLGETGVELLTRIKAAHTSAGHGHGGKAAAPSEEVHDLTLDQLPAEWALAELQWICAPGRTITYGILKPGPDYPSGVPYVRVADFPNDCLRLPAIKRTSPAIAHEYRRAALRSGDLLLSIRGSAGRVVRVPDQLDGANITQDTARISVDPAMNSAFVMLCLRSPGTQERMGRAMRGVAVRGVNIGDVRALQVAIPPLEEQHEIVRRVEALFALADRVEQRVAAARARADRLTQAILSRAFRGELVPTEAELARRDGREYEPASVLLERIREERGAMGNGAGRSARRGQRASENRVS